MNHLSPLSNFSPFCLSLSLSLLSTSYTVAIPLLLLSSHSFLIPFWLVKVSEGEWGITLGLLQPNTAKLHCVIAAHSPSLTLCYGWRLKKKAKTDFHHLRKADTIYSSFISVIFCRSSFAFTIISSLQRSFLQKDVLYMHACVYTCMGLMPSERSKHSTHSWNSLFRRWWRARHLCARALRCLESSHARS